MINMKGCRSCLHGLHATALFQTIGQYILESIEYLTWWPKEDYFNAVIKKLDYRKKFKVDNKVLSYKKPKS